MPPRGRPLLDFGPAPLPPPPSYAAAHDEEEEKDAPPLRWYHYFPTGRTSILCPCLLMQLQSTYVRLIVTIVFLLAPHPSWMIVLVNYHLAVLHDPWLMARHLIISYALTLLAFSSLMVIIVRDPGRVNAGKHNEDNDENEEMNLTQALLADDSDINTPGRWCRKCWAPKPERTHQ